ncbi:MAG TPA: hypothetical protein VNA30_03950 [Mycobacteriales bacterium]|nr:hypothetical protein [Mycobacteriales bacterium]
MATWSLAAGALLATAGGAEAAPYLRPSLTTFVTVGHDGKAASGLLGSAIGASGAEISVSGDARFIAFASPAANLVPGDTNQVVDVFVHDRLTRRTELISVGQDGRPAVGNCNAATGSGNPAITPDGRYVAFHSCAANLVPGDLNLDRDVFVRDRRTQRTEIVSLSSAGKQGASPAIGHGSSTPTISDSGRLVAFTSAANDLVPGDTNGVTDVFVRDRATAKLAVASVSSAEGPSDGHTGSPSLSGDGRFLAFTSAGTNLVTGDLNRNLDVFVRDLTKGTTERVSVPTGGGEGTVTAASTSFSTGGRAISGDGRYVAFASGASNLVPNDSNGTGLVSAYDIFVHDRLTRRTERVSLTSQGRQPSQGSSVGSISPDGRYVTFSSTANDLSEGDTGVNGSNTITVGTQPGDHDVFLHDRLYGTTEMLSRSPTGTEAQGHCPLAAALGASQDSSESLSPSVSNDGRRIAFVSCATNLASPDTNAAQDVFLRDRGPSLGVGDLISTRKGGSVQLSGWATFSGARLAGEGDSPKDGVADSAVSGAELIGAELLYRPELDDLLLRMDLAGMPVAGVALGGVSAAGDPRVLYGLQLSAAGQGYEVRISRAAANAANPLDAAFGLFSCSELTCAEVAALQGGYGTSGHQIVVSVPLAALTKAGKPLAEGGLVSVLRAFSSYGTYLGGSTQLLDQVLLTKAPSVPVPMKSVTLTAGRTTVRAALVNGRFTASIPRSAFGSARSVLVKTCLGTTCHQERVPVNI